MDGLVGGIPDKELREIEQYFFTESVLESIVNTLAYEDDIMCLCTPAVADAFWRLKAKTVLCLDIDRRFDYLPNYKYYDLLTPSDVDFVPKILIVDPPFFIVNLVDLFNCVEVLTKGDKTTKIILAFVQREEKALLNIFKPYSLQLTKFKLEYRHVDPTKWNNYSLYSNFEMGKIKFYNKKTNQKKFKK